MLNEIQGSRFQEGQTKRTLQFLARTVEQKLNATTSYAYNVLYHHLGRKLESYMEKWKIADLADLKCKDRNH